MSARASAPVERVDVAVVGGGPAGLAAAAGLAAGGRLSVVVFDREPETGGIARHSHHLGYGVRDLGRVLSGPAYARRHSELVRRAGADVRVLHSVTGWDGERRLTVTSPGGVTVVECGAVLLATGTRERPRSARLVAGSRPAGVFTTGSLQRLAALPASRLGGALGRRAVVVGTEHVSFSAALTLAHAGCEVVAMVGEDTRDRTYPPYRWGSAGLRRVPILRGRRVVEVTGRGRVDGVVLDDGRRLDCDTVVFSGDWVAENEIARRGGVEMAEPGRGPVVDGSLRTSTPGVFAAGNLIHGAETADVCALDGRHTVAPVIDWLDSGRWPAGTVALDVAPPLRWVSPDRLATPLVGEGGPPRDRYLLRVSTAVRSLPAAVVRQGGATLWEGRVRGLARPTLPLWIPTGWERAVDPEGPAVTITLT